tara:strand:- start:368 stop:1981 length:1614 start_codon:yes stop_codon:yes gene_type:complete
MAINEEIFLGSGASITLVPEVDFYLELHSSSTSTVLACDSAITNNFRFVKDLYVGCVLDMYDYSTSTSVPASSHIITTNGVSGFTISPAHTLTLASNDFAVIRSYNAPCAGEKDGTTARLNADNWLGLVESATFPNVEQEMKQLNLQLGGSRNFSHQYKGIRTASGGNIALMANHGTWLYYALGQCTNINATMSAQAPATQFVGNAADDVYIDTADGGAESDHDVTEMVSTGPLFYKTSNASMGSNKTLMPPVLLGSDTHTNLEKLTRTTSTASGNDNLIAYTFAELNTADLPSFALEQSMSKLESSNTYVTGDTGIATESHTFTRIARGNRVNTLTMTANENEEVKMTLDLNTGAVHKLATDESYEARGGQTTNTSLFNYTTTGDAELGEPFFFSNGSISIFGQQFLKITNFTLTINNNLVDKRFVGIGSKDLKHAIPAQRNYEISFTALVTDNKLFEEIFNETEETSTDTIANGLLDLTFDKDTGEQIKIQFKNYHLSANTWTIPDDKGPITVEATVMPRDLHSCVVKTGWVLQG